MNVGELLRERDRLLSVLEEAKSAKARLKQLNILITMYGDDEKVSLNGTVPASEALTSLPNVPLVSGLVECDQCGGWFKGKVGISMHKNKTHGIKSPSASTVRQRKLAKGHK